MSGLLDRIAAHGARPPVRVPVPEWGVDLYFRPLTPAQATRINKGIAESDHAALAVNFIVELALDGSGKRVFEGTPEERATLEGKADLAVITRIVTQARATDSTAPQNLEPADAKNA